MSATDPASSPRPGLLRRTLHRHWKGLLVVWLLGSTALMALAYLNIRPNYKAYSLLRVEPTSNNLFGVNTNAETFDVFLNTQVQLIIRPKVLAAAGTNSKVAAIGRIQAAGDVVQELRKSVTVGIVPNTYLIEVSAISPDPLESQVIVDAVVEAYLDTNSEWSDGMIRTQTKNLETYLRDLQNQTDELERKWKDLVAKGDIDNRLLDDFKRQGAN
jgi:polysaccharide biosynthesis transport protein